jgi:hypothetical protein
VTYYFFSFNEMVDVAVIVFVVFDVYNGGGDFRDIGSKVRVVKRGVGKSITFRESSNPRIPTGS